ncbi:MAG: DNA polymerase III subunit gamma/tau [Raoultibacter sp.]
MSEALYRKYRPQTFVDVIGQDQIERTIRNAIEQDKVSHAYLFCGPRGTGKTTTARLLAKALLCEHGPTPDPDGTCGDCREIADGVHPDVYELDAASRTGVENVREEIIGRVHFAPTRGRCKVYIIDEVHMLSTAAFNALLKTLEEPPDHVVFILCTTDPQKVPDTIHSRCQRFDFRRIAADAIVSRLGAICVSEEVEFEGEALDLIAHRAEGGMRNALTALEQVIAFGEGKVTLANAENMLGALDCDDMAEIVTYIGRRDIAACFSWTARYIETGADLAQFTRDLAEYVRDMYVLSLAGSDVSLEVSEATRREMARELNFFGPDRLTNLLHVLGELLADLRVSTNSRLSFEIALTRMVRPDSDLTLTSLADRLEALEAGHFAGAQVVVAPEVSAIPASLPAESFVAPSTATSQPAVREVAVPPVASVSPLSAAGTPRPEAAVAPAGAVVPVVSVLQNPASLQRVWQAALVELKKTKPAYSVMFLNTKVTFDEADQGLIVAFSAENSFAFLTVQKPDIVEELRRVLRQAAGGEVSFRFVKEGEAVQGRTSSPAAIVPTAASRPAEKRSAATSDTVAGPTPSEVAISRLPTNSGEAAPSGFDSADVVPLDAYDSMAPFSYGDVAAEHSAPVQESAVASADRGVSASQVPASDAVLAVPTKENAREGFDDHQEDIAALLAASFGDGVIVEEVDGRA